jgi:hypothetical protein
MKFLSLLLRALTYENTKKMISIQLSEFRSNVTECKLFPCIIVLDLNRIIGDNRFWYPILKRERVCVCVDEIE